MADARSLCSRRDSATVCGTGTGREPCGALRAACELAAQRAGAELRLTARKTRESGRGPPATPPPLHSTTSHQAVQPCVAHRPPLILPHLCSSATVHSVLGLRLPPLSPPHPPFLQPCSHVHWPDRGDRRRQVGARGRYQRSDHRHHHRPHRPPRRRARCLHRRRRRLPHRHLLLPPALHLHRRPLPRDAAADDLRRPPPLLPRQSRALPSPPPPTSAATSSRATSTPSAASPSCRRMATR